MKWQPTPVCLPGNFHGQRSLVGFSPWGHKESDTTEHSPSHTVKLMGIKTRTEEHELISSFKDVCKSFERLYVLQKPTLLTQIVSRKIKAL